MHSHGRSRVIIVSLVIVCAVVLAARIAWVNINAERNSEEHYSMGEWVDLSGTYFENLEWENYDGYFLRVNNAEALSLNEYRSRYGNGEYADVEIEGMNGDEKSILVVDYDIRNDGNSESGIALIDHSLIPESKNIDYALDYDLWKISEPASEDAQGEVGILAGTEYVSHVPYTFVSNPPYFQKYDYEIRMPITDRKFELVVSNGPVRKIIDIGI